MAARGCSRDLVPPLKTNGITAVNAITVSPAQMTAMMMPLAMPDGRLPVPLSVANGLADEAIDPKAQFRAVRALCARGEQVIWRTYPRVGHSATSVTALAGSIPFADAVLAGRKPASTCTGLVEPGALQTPDPAIPFNAN